MPDVNPPAPSLEGGGVVLEPFDVGHAQDLDALAREDAVRRFTLVPSLPEEGFGRVWAERYVDGWKDGSRAGFAVGDSASGAFLGFVALVHLDMPAREAEAGYALRADAAGRGAATAALSLLTDWALTELGLERIELRIDPENAASERVAARCGYIREGVLRSVHFKDGRRTDIAIWSHLRSDAPTSARPNPSGDSARRSL